MYYTIWAADQTARMHKQVFSWRGSVDCPESAINGSNIPSVHLSILAFVNFNPNINLPTSFLVSALEFRLITCKWATAQQNQQNDLCAQWRLRLAWESAQTDQMIDLDSYSRQVFIYMDPILIYISLWIDCLFEIEIHKIAVCFLWLSLPGDCRVTDEALLAETT